MGQLKLEAKPASQAFTFEATRAQGPATLGIKCTDKSYAAPDVGLRVSQSGVFASLLVTDKFSTFAAHAHYKLTDTLDLAVQGTKKGAKPPSGGAGIAFKLDDKTTVKAKVDSSGAIESVVKYSPSKGLSVLKYGKY